MQLMPLAVRQSEDAANASPIPQDRNLPASSALLIAPRENNACATSKEIYALARDGVNAMRRDEQGGERVSSRRAIDSVRRFVSSGRSFETTPTREARRIEFKDDDAETILTSAGEPVGGDFVSESAKNSH